MDKKLKILLVFLPVVFCVFFSIAIVLSQEPTLVTVTFSCEPSKHDGGYIYPEGAILYVNSQPYYLDDFTENFHQHLCTDYSDYVLTLELAPGSTYYWQNPVLGYWDGDAWFITYGAQNGTIYSSSTLGVVYTLYEYVEITSIGGGTVTPTSGYYIENGWDYLGALVPIEAIPEAGYGFTNWVTSGFQRLYGTNDSTTFMKVTSPGTIQAIFKLLPIANAGPDQELDALGTINLDGTSSNDPAGNPITYSWSFASVPKGSNATLAGATTATPSFVADAYGDYEVLLVVSDNWSLPSAPDIVIVHVAATADVNADLQDLRADIMSLDPSVFLRSRLQGLLANSVNQSIAYVQAGEYTLALDQLVNGVMKYTDGCALYDAPDKTDWIRTSGAQAIVYPEVVEAIELVLQLMEG